MPVAQYGVGRYGIDTYGPGDTALSAAFSGQYGPVDVRLRFYQTDQQNNTLADISTAALPDSGSVSLQNDRAVPRTLSLDLDGRALPSAFTTATDQNLNIAPHMQVLVSGTWLDFQLGLYYLDKPDRTYTPGYSVWHAQGSDFCLLLQRATTTTTYVVPAGSDYLRQVAAIIAGQGFTVGSSISGGTSYLTPVDFTWPPATPYLTIVNDLLMGINYYAVWCDAYGTFQTRQRIDPATETSATTYTTQTEPIMVADGEYGHQHQLSQYPNQHAVVIDDPARIPQSVTLTNNDPTSLLSVISLKTTKRKELRGASGEAMCVLDLATATAMAAFELKDAAALALNKTISTFADPRRTNREFYTMTVYDTRGAIDNAQLHRVIGWSMKLAAGDAMQHQIGPAKTVQLTM